MRVPLDRERDPTPLRGPAPPLPLLDEQPKEQHHPRKHPKGRQRRNVRRAGDPPRRKQELGIGALRDLKARLATEAAGRGQAASDEAIERGEDCVGRSEDGFGEDRGDIRGGGEGVAEAVLGPAKEAPHDIPGDAGGEDSGEEDGDFEHSTTHVDLECFFGGGGHGAPNNSKEEKVRGN